MGMDGDTTLSLYGPFSPFRAIAAPVLLQPTSFGGSPYQAVGTGFSTPFLPPASPIVYPTRANVSTGFGYQRTPPWWDSGFGWVDQN
jgi:hypothetical protein